MKYTVFFLLAMGLTFSCFQLNLTGLENGTMVLPENETCFELIGKNYTLQHNNTIVIQNITNVTNVTVQNCSFSFINVSLGSDECHFSEARNTSYCCNAEITTCDTCNFTEAECPTCSTSQNFTHLNYTFEPGDSGCNEARSICWEVEEAEECESCPECEAEKYIPSNYIDISEPLTLELVPGDSVMNSNRNVLVWCSPTKQIPSSMENCKSPVMGWYCQDFLFDKCTSSEAESVDFGGCSERREEAAAGDVEECQEDLKDEKSEHNQCKEDLDTQTELAETRKTQITQSQYDQLGPLLVLACIVLTVMVIREYWPEGKGHKIKFPGTPGEEKGHQKQRLIDNWGDD